MAASVMFRKALESTIKTCRRGAAHLNVLQCTNHTLLKTSPTLFKPNIICSSYLRTNVKPTWNLTPPRPVQEIVEDPFIEEKAITEQVISDVNEQIRQGNEGRLFAVVQVCGKQFKITSGDIIIVEGYWPPEIGDQLKLEKVLLAGSADFTLIGRPILSRDLVSVEATVIEKSLSHLKTHFRKKRRKQFMRINFTRSPLTTLRINCIQLKGEVNEQQDVEGVAGRIF